MDRTRRVYSYLRFSDPKQSEGGSVDRQLEYARRWAVEHGLVLDESLTMRDEGLSAYHQRHVTRGMLGLFLAAVDEGRVPPGSVLIVEGLDRLSRAEPIQAQAQLAQIINAGITVVTASDGKEYNRQRLKDQPMDLVYSLLVMIRAHEESDTKSKRVKAAIRRQCDAWLTGKWRGIIRNGKDPAWVAWNGQAFELIPDRAESVRLAIEMFMDGHGAMAIISRLRSSGVTFAANASHLYKMIRNRALVGDRVLTVDGEEFVLPGYYPALMSEAEFAELQRLASQRHRRKGKGEIPGVITGMGICRCGYCGSAMVAQNLMSRKKRPDGKPHDGHRRLICVASSNAQACKVNGSCSVVPVEDAIMEWCADAMNLASLMSGGDAGVGLRAELAAARARVVEIERQIERVTEAMLSSDAPPSSFAKKARELENDLAHEQDIIGRCESELAARARLQIPGMADAWAALVDGVKALDYDARLKTRQLVADTFSRIDVYHSGLLPGDGKVIDIVLHGRSGAVRVLSGVLRGKTVE